MYESITIDWLPYHTNRWPKSVKRRGFMFCHCFRHRLGENFKEYVNEIENRFTELLGARGKEWASRYDNKTMYFEVFTKNQDWMLMDKLSSELGYSVLSTHIALIEERQTE